MKAQESCDEGRFYKEMGRYLIKGQLVMIGSRLGTTYLSTFVYESGQQFPSIFFSLILEDTHISSITLSSCLLTSVHINYSKTSIIL